MTDNDNITITATLAGHVVVDGGAGSDAYTIAFGNLAGTAVVADSGAGVGDSDQLTANGTDTQDTFNKHAGFIKWRPTGAPSYLEESDFDGMESVTLNAGAGNDTILDPNSGNFSILGGPGDDTITIAENIGLVTVDGGDGSDTYVIEATASYLVSREFIGREGTDNYVIEAGSPQGGVTIDDTGTSGADEVHVVGTTSDDTITQSGDEIVANGATFTLAGADALVVDGGGGTGDAFTVIGTPTVPATVEGVSDMVVTGTVGDDQIQFLPGNNPGEVIARVNGIVVATSHPTGHLIAQGLAGDDVIQVASGVTVPAWLYGDAGDDHLNAGNGGSLLIGGDGNDELLGGNGRDVMIGGEGADKLLGNGNDDILVADLTKMDSRSVAGHDAFWSNLLAEWNSGHSFAERLVNLRPVLLPEVENDAFSDAIDFLNGSAGEDWLVFLTGEDKVTGKAEAAN